MLTRPICALALLSLAACTSTRIDNVPATANRTGRAYLVRGILTPVCLGIDRMARDFRAAGLDASAHSYVQAGQIATTIERSRAAGAREPIVLIGYSTGSDTVYGLAKRLQRSNIPVDLLVTIDPLPVMSARVPANVRHAVNYYHRIVPGIPLLAGRTASAENAAATQLENIDFAHEGHPRGFLNHFNMDEQPEIVSAVRSLALAACPPQAGGRRADERERPAEKPLPTMHARTPSRPPEARL